MHELNLDPRFRVAAGFGTGVVQDKQEDYMDAAWEQVGDVLEANQRIRSAQLAQGRRYGLARRATCDRSTRASREQWLALSAPLHARVMTARRRCTTAAVPGSPTQRACRAARRLSRAAMRTVAAAARHGS